MELYVDHVMSRPVETIEPTASLRDAAAAMIRHDVGALVVVDDNDRLEGILTATDFVLLAVEGELPPDEPVATPMRTDVITVERDAPASEAVDAMLDHLIHHVPVVENETVVGMVSTFDFTARLGRSLEP
ncbi:hypothetical protein JCM30237_24570 [Halolamina litorea]|uniref:Cyclic nucleotide-binding/CBS domain-containing protein n=1 Tax=Halolamina litorea TaxID=1515593 RepID=A0ABD6BUR0_9EURY|nr:CBS domain-containing protein [Halolamina litorea]